MNNSDILEMKKSIDQLNEKVSQLSNKVDQCNKLNSKKIISKLISALFQDTVLSKGVH